MSILHEFFFTIFTFVINLAMEKPLLNPKSPKPQLCGFFWFLVKAPGFGSMSHFFALVGC